MWRIDAGLRRHALHCFDKSLRLATWTLGMSSCRQDASYHLWSPKDAKSLGSLWIPKLVKIYDGFPCWKCMIWVILGPLSRNRSHISPRSPRQWTWLNFRPLTSSRIAHTGTGATAGTNTSCLGPGESCSDFTTENLRIGLRDMISLRNGCWTQSKGLNSAPNAKQCKTSRCIP